MSATIGMNRLKVEPYGSFVTVPNNDIAKLMYYLSCVSSVIQYDDNTFTDYQNYYKLTVEEYAAVLALASILNPQLFIEANIFIVNPNLLFDSSGNQFYKITDETIGVHVNQEIMIGGRAVKVLNVMACNNNWLLEYYYTPINAIKRMISRKDIGYGEQVVNTSSSTSTSNPVTNAPIITQEFRDKPISTICSSCHRQIVTRTKMKFNCVACFCFLFTGILYICVQACLDKNICCCDVIHRCPNCGVVLGEFESC